MNNKSKNNGPMLDQIIETTKKFLETLRPGMDRARMQRVIRQLEVVKENLGK